MKNDRDNKGTAKYRELFVTFKFWKRDGFPFQAKWSLAFKDSQSMPEIKSLRVRATLCFISAQD